jgi:putative transcriptional regulator
LEITDGIFWGGDFENVLTLLNANALKPNEIKFFIGYSGWSEGQLEAEIETKSWITRQATNELIFDTTAKQIWKNALKEMDGEYKQMIHYPLDPQLN